MKRVHWHILSIQLLNFLSIFACVSFCHRRSFNQLPELGAAKWPYGEWMTVYWQASSSARCFICIVALKPKNNFLIKVDVSILKVMETGSARWSDTLRLVCLKGRAGMWLALPGLGVYLSHVRALPDNIGSQRTWILVLPLPSALLSEANSILGPDLNFTIWYKKHRPYLYLLFVLCKHFVNQCFELSIHSFTHSLNKLLLNVQVQIITAIISLIVDRPSTSVLFQILTPRRGTSAWLTTVP